jgi:hypothetical protein
MLLCKCVAKQSTTFSYLTILESADHALFKMLKYFFFLRPLRPELDVIQKNAESELWESRSTPTLALHASG